MWKTALRIIEPVATRVGTALGGVLLGVGVAEPHANAIALGATAALLVAADFASRWLIKRKSK